MLHPRADRIQLLFDIDNAIQPADVRMTEISPYLDFSFEALGTHRELRLISLASRRNHLLGARCIVEGASKLEGDLK